MSGHTATHRVLSAHDEFEARASEDEMKRAASSAAARTASFVQTTLLHSGPDGIIGFKKYHVIQSCLFAIQLVACLIHIFGGGGFNKAGYSWGYTEVSIYLLLKYL